MNQTASISPAEPAQQYTSTEGKVYDNPQWTHEPADPDYAACGAVLYQIACGYAKRFVRSHVADFRAKRENLVSVAIVHVLIQAKRGRLDRVPADARWSFICRMLWNKMIDESRRFCNRRELQSPTMHDDAGEGSVLDSDQSLEVLRYDQLIDESAKKDVIISISVPRREIRLLETMLDTALKGAPDEQLAKLRYGLYRDDEVGIGRASYLDPCTMEDLVEMGYGSDRFAVRRRIDRALRLLRARILADVKRRGIGSFTT